MGYELIRTDHAGAKNGGGAWMTRADAKEQSKRRRRDEERRLLNELLLGGEPSQSATWNRSGDTEGTKQRRIRGNRQ